MTRIPAILPRSGAATVVPSAAPANQDEPDYLRCTECGAETQVRASSLYDSMGRRKDGKLRRRTGWIRTLSALVAQWRCDDCLTAAEQELAE